MSRSRQPREALRFAAAVEAALSARGWTAMRLAAESGVARSTVTHVKLGYHLPSLPVASRLAEALHEPDLAELAVRLRDTECADCGRVFVAARAGGKRARFCSDTCSHRALQRRYRASAARRVTMAEREVAAVREAVQAFCLQCEPDRICRDDGCGLRPVSPLPFVRINRGAA